MTDNINVDPDVRTTSVAVNTDEDVVSAVHTPVYKVGVSDPGQPPVQVTPANPFPVDMAGRITAFGELSVAQPTQVVSLQFPYNINASQVISFPGNGGSVASINDQATVSTGTAADGFSLILSRNVIKYSAGQGGLARFTALFTQGVADSEQIIGVGANLAGFFFGFNGADFGVLRRTGGLPEVRTLTITTASTTAENISITLNGATDTTVAVTNSNDVCVTAREIADHNFASVGGGWGAASAGDRVIFVSFSAESRPGSYAISATTAVGSYNQDIEGVEAIDSWVSQTDWNTDKMDGAGVSGVNLDITKGNVYQIRYQWLGYGAISYYVEAPATGMFQLVHRISYANANTQPSVSNPTFPMTAEVRNFGNTSNLEVKSSSMAGFIEGANEAIGPAFTTSNLITLSNTLDELPILTIRNKQIYQSTINQVRIAPLLVTMVSTLGNSNINLTIRAYINATPEAGCIYSDISTNSSVVEVDVDAAAFTAGPTSQLIATVILSSIDSSTIEIDQLRTKVAPGSTLMITAQCSKTNAGNEAGASITWKELF